MATNATMLALCLLSLHIAALIGWSFDTSFQAGMEVNAVDISLDNQYILVGLQSGEVQLYNSSNLNKWKQFTSISYRLHDAKFSPDQRFIAACWEDGNKIVIFNGTKPLQIITNVSTVRSIYDLDWSYDSSKLLVCGSNKAVKIYSSQTWTEIFSDTSLSGVFRSCAFAPDGSFAAGQDSGKIRVYNSDESIRWTHTASSSNYILKLDWNPSSSILIASDNNKKIFYYDPASSSSASSFEDGQQIWAMTYYPGGTYYVAGGADKKANWYNGASGSLNSKQFTTSQPQDMINSIAFSWDGTMCAMGSKDHRVYIYGGTPTNITIPTSVTAANSTNSTNSSSSANSTNTTNTTNATNASSSSLVYDPDCPLQYFKNNSACLSCASHIAGCRICYDASTCLACSTLYYLDSGGDCLTCNSAISACISCESNTTCLQCLSGYTPSNGTCSNCWDALQGCVRCSSTTVCSECAKDDYYLSANRTCVSCLTLPNCATCSSNTTCSECLPAHYNSNGTCTQCSNGCQICNSTSECQSCSEVLYLNGTTCVSCPINCLSCNSTSCQQCTLGFYHSSGQCNPCESPCHTCLNSTFCTACASDSYLSSSGTCQQCSDPCLSCSNSSYCISCDTGAYLTVNANCQSCTSHDPNCLLCDQSQCLTCSSGFFINNNSCSRCEDSLAGCLLCSNSSNCLVCESGTYLDNVTCLSCVYPCVQCTGNVSACQVCAQGYYSSNGTCQTCPCATCTSATECLSCSTHQFLSNGTCKECQASIGGCLSCSNSSSCSSCTRGFYLANATCLQCPFLCSECDSTGCLDCQTGAYLSNSSCSLCPSSCSSCSNSSTCSACYTGYYLVNSTCTACNLLFSGCMSCSASECLSCSLSQGHYLHSNGTCDQCQNVVLNCRQCYNSTTCISCDTSFYLTVNFTCVACDLTLSHCQTCTNSSWCQLCLPGYYSLNGSCQNCVLGCQICTSATVCIKASTLYTPVSAGNSTLASCNQLIPHCLSCLNSTHCLACTSGAYLTSSICQLCSFSLPGCSVCASSIQCLSCSSSFYLNATSCLSCATLNPSCLICNQHNATECLQCLQGWTAVGGLCEQCQIANCQVCVGTSSVCAVCNFGYFLENNTCTLCINRFEGCEQCNGSVCSLCQLGYYLDNTTQYCQKCPDQSCKACNVLDPAKCVTCNEGYYLTNSSICQPCNSLISKCSVCSPNSTCLQCLQGYYITASNTCSLCQSIHPDCYSCTQSTCLTCLTGFTLPYNSTSCQSCSVSQPNCAECHNTTTCVFCLDGYYLNSNGSCQRCGNTIGCLLCQQSAYCLKCSVEYYLSGGLCISCNTSLENCLTCSSNSTCIACIEEYIISDNVCIYPLQYSPPTITFTTIYLSAEELEHTVLSNPHAFHPAAYNLTPHTNISCLLPNSTVILLTIQSYSQPHPQKLRFITNNPFDFSPSSPLHLSMRLFNKRLLTQTTNINSNVDFQLTMTAAATNDVLPAASGASLNLIENIEQPEFIASLRQHYQYYYWLFGLIIGLILLIMGLGKVYLFWGKRQKVAGVAAHVLLCKMPALMLFPAFSQMYDFCEGFMLFDLPWVNLKMGERTGQLGQKVPGAYRVFYNSLNFASTHLLVACLLLGLALTLAALYYCWGAEVKKGPQLWSLWTWLLDFCYGGLVVASFSCLMNIFVNEQTQLTANTACYLAGIIIYLWLIIDSVYSLIEAHNSQWSSVSYHLHRPRLLVKATILALCHNSPLYLYPITLITEAIFSFAQIQSLPKSHLRNYWLSQQACANLALIFLVQLSHSLTSIYFSMALLTLVTVLQGMIISCEYQEVTAQQTDEMVTVSEILPTQQPIEQSHDTYKQILQMTVPSPVKEEGKLSRQSTGQYDIQPIIDSYTTEYKEYEDGDEFDLDEPAPQMELVFDEGDQSKAVSVCQSARHSPVQQKRFASSDGLLNHLSRETQARKSSVDVMVANECSFESSPSVQIEEEPSEPEQLPRIKRKRHHGKARKQLHSTEDLQGMDF